MPFSIPIGPMLYRQSLSYLPLYFRAHLGNFSFRKIVPITLHQCVSAILSPNRKRTATQAVLLLVSGYEYTG